MPTKETGKSKFYLIDKNGEAKELGTGTIEFNSVEAEENNKKWEELKKIYTTQKEPEEIEIKLKKYSKKRFKKILMAEGIQRNDAEIFATIAGKKGASLHRSSIGIIIAKMLYDRIKKEREEK